MLSSIWGPFRPSKSGGQHLGGRHGSAAAGPSPRVRLVSVLPGASGDAKGSGVKGDGVGNPKKGGISMDFFLRF